jgi:LacI family transcriptional regulator
MHEKPPPDTRRATIRDVARSSGVSVATVSYALNRPERISEAQRLRVLEAVAALGYQPNRLAQGLRRGQSRLVGISVPHLASAYFAELVNSIEGAAGRDGYHVLQVLHHHRPAVERLRIAALLDHRVAGLLVVPSEQPAAALDMVAGAKVPTVVLDRPLPDARFDQVVFDNRAAMGDVAGHLLGLGHRHIVFAISHPGLITTRQRIETLEHLAAGRARVTLLRQDAAEPAFHTRLAAALADGATAIIASNTQVGLWTLRGLQAMGVAMPGDVSLLMFDHPDWADIVTPRLSVVETPGAAMAEAAWAMLLARMTGGAGPAETVELRAGVRFAGSTALARTA